MSNHSSSFRSSNLSRRDWLRVATGTAVAPWLAPLASAVAASPERKRSCILLWMNGGPSTIDLWDVKAGHEHGGPTKTIATRTPGLELSEHLPQLARWSDHLAVIRSLTTKEGDHGRASHLLRSGYAPQGAIQFPALGALVARDRTERVRDLPDYVSIAPPRGTEFNLAGGFLGPGFNPLVLGQEPAPTVDQALQIANLRPHAPLESAETSARLDVLSRRNRRFAASRPGAVAASGLSAVDGAVRLMKESSAEAFDLTQELEGTRDAYGRSLFGQGVLLARRLIERDVPFVEVTLDGWDTHANNFAQVAELAAVFDRAWSALMQDLQDRGRLDSTLVVWMGEFGRTPRINAQTGRDHWPQGFSTVLAGGGIRGGQAFGATSPDGTTVIDRPVNVPDVLATICTALGIDCRTSHLSNVNRPIWVVDQSAAVIEEVLG